MKHKLNYYSIFVKWPCKALTNSQIDIIYQILGKYLRWEGDGSDGIEQDVSFYIEASNSDTILIAHRALEAFIKENRLHRIKLRFGKNFKDIGYNALLNDSTWMSN